MSEIYLILVIVLFALAASDLIVGVSNDAVNFLNSAIGSKAAPRWIVFGMAAVGILVGSIFSSGMMEVARKGVFHPEAFYFSEIMVIFLAVMITDVILLDLFNTFGFPTSTTVSLVFELLGSAVAVSLTKMRMAGEAASEISKYINSEKALLIIGGILVSVVIAFTVGAIIQWVTRLLFSFRYEKRINRFGAIYGGLSIAIITYFIFGTGMKDAAFMPKETSTYIINHLFSLIAISFVIWTVILQILYWLFKIDILKIVVLFGTFALAMAFAGNDLVNFIGVPLAGFAAFKAWVVSGMAPDEFTMEMLGGKVQTPTFMLVLAGVIMTVTLITSKKAKSVIKTSVDLSRQNEGDERFGSSALSRFVVRASLSASENMSRIMPDSAKRFVSRQFAPIPDNEQVAVADRPAFDKLRAASILMVSSILISIGTSYKLPLSTTYVTFMVAMGTSLADRAWGRESAVYRISGVMAVIGGWFLTAIIAFTASFVIAKIISIGGFIAIAVLVAIALFVVIRTQIAFRRKNGVVKTEDEDLISEVNINSAKVLEKCNKNTVKAIISTSKAYFLCFEGFFNNDRQQMKNAMTEVDEFNAKAKKLKDGVYKNVQKLKQDSLDSSHFYVQVIGYLRELAHSVHYVVEPMYVHYENKHKPFTPEQVEQLNEFGIELNDFFNYAIHILKENKIDSIDDLIEKRNILVERLKLIEKDQIKRIKANEVSTRNSVLFFNIITETKSMLLNLINLVKAQRDFNSENKQLLN